MVGDVNYTTYFILTTGDMNIIGRGTYKKNFVFVKIRTRNT